MLCCGLRGAPVTKKADLQSPWYRKLCNRYCHKVDTFKMFCWVLASWLRAGRWTLKECTLPHLIQEELSTHVIRIRCFDNSTRKKNAFTTLLRQASKKRHVSRFHPGTFPGAPRLLRCTSFSYVLGFCAGAGSGVVSSVRNPR